MFLVLIMELRIALIIPSLLERGPNIVAWSIVESLKDKLHFEVFYLDEIGELKFGCKTHKISMFKSVDFSGFQIVHSHMLRPDIYSWLYVKNAHVVRVSTIHQYIFDNLSDTNGKLVSNLVGRFWIWVLSSFPVLTTINRHMVDYYRTFIQNSKIVPIYNGVAKPAKEVLKSVNLPKDKKIIVSNSLLIKRKGIDLLLQALKGLNDFHLLLFGDGEERAHLENLAVQLDIQTRVSFAGFISDSSKYISCASVFVMPSRSEGFGLAIAEAAACEIPIVATDIPSFREMFSEDEVFFFEPENVSSLQQAILMAEKDGTQNTAKAYKKWETKFSNLVFAQNWLDFYQHIRRND